MIKPILKVMIRKYILFLFIAFATTAIELNAQTVELNRPVAGTDVVFDEVNGLAAVEAEHFYKQVNTDLRQWFITSKGRVPDINPDPDEEHIDGASGNAYIEILPDTRTNNSDKLIRFGDLKLNETNNQMANFSDDPGQMAILHYKVNINKPGRYYIWVRAYSTGSEDNGLHVGFSGTWPAHGQRMQWCDGKNNWTWGSKQRTEAAHCGVPKEIYLDIDKAGLHDIQFSMREDGFEMDKFILTNDSSYIPEGEGPAPKLLKGTLPVPFIIVEDSKDGNGNVTFTGELKQWHKVTLNLNGPFASETDKSPNPYSDYRMTVTFTHESGSPAYKVPAYFAADGKACETSATEGYVWRAHLSPDKIGKWNYKISFLKGTLVAIADMPWMKVLEPFNGTEGSFEIAATDKTGRDFRAKGRLRYVGKNHLQFIGSREFFFKCGTDSPETLLAFEDFDNTITMKPNAPVKKYLPHLIDFNEGDPTWKDGKGKGLVGAVNYIAAEGLNSISFLTYNAGGDGDNVWPFVSRNEKMNYDCSKLDQWQIIFDHAQSKGIYLHFKTQETENDDHRYEVERIHKIIPEALDAGELGPERMLYYRELIARFGYLLALNWNLGEENSQSSDVQKALTEFFYNNDPYRHNVVIHSYPSEQDRVYTPLLGNHSQLTGASLQNPWHATFKQTLRWITESNSAGKPWIVANDEQGSASHGVPPDNGYKGFDPEETGFDLHDIRKQTLWGNLMAGGAGVEYYFGYKLPENDLLMEDFRSRDKSWDFCRIAVNFLIDNNIPFQDMKNMDALIGNNEMDKEKHCLGKPGEIYLVYLAYVNTTNLDLAYENGDFTVEWFNPVTGGSLQKGNVRSVKGGKTVSLGKAPKSSNQDWVVLVRRK